MEKKNVSAIMFSSFRMETEDEEMVLVLGTTGSHCFQYIHQLFVPGL